MRLGKLLLAVGCMYGCGTGVTGSDGVPPAGHGTLRLELTGAGAPPSNKAEQILVTITKVTAHSVEQGWVELFQGSQTIDLYQLNSHGVQLGLSQLPAGKVTQLRLYTDDGATQEVVLPSGEAVDLKVPSGVQSGIKIKGPFEIKACASTLLTLALDRHKSIWVHPRGKNEEWILRPVIHAGKTMSEPVGCADPSGGNPTGGSTPTTTPSGGSTPVPEGPGGSGGAGSGCTMNSACLSNLCVQGTCASGGPGVPCRLAADCVSGQCGDDGSCGSGSAGGSGSPCALNSECLSNACVAGSCDSGSQGAPCKVNADCNEAYSCYQGTCFPNIN